MVESWKSVLHLKWSLFMGRCSYCWWFRNLANQLSLVVYPHYLRKVFAPSQVVGWDFWTISLDIQGLDVPSPAVTQSPRGLGLLWEPWIEGKRGRKFILLDHQISVSPHEISGIYRRMLETWYNISCVGVTTIWISLYMCVCVFCICVYKYISIYIYTPSWELTCSRWFSFSRLMGYISSLDGNMFWTIDSDW